jgi:hypothetical protein
LFTLGIKTTRIDFFTILLTYSVHQMLKLHHVMDSQFLRYHTVLGAACEDGNGIIISQFAEAVLAGTLRARLIGADAFSETGHTRCAVYLWVALQTHRVLKCHIELGFTAHPEVSDRGAYG